MRIELVGDLAAILSLGEAPSLAAAVPLVAGDRYGRNHRFRISAWA
jgi:hypothetical protein